MNRFSYSAIAMTLLVLLGATSVARAADNSNDRTGKTVTARVAAQLKQAKESLKNEEYNDALSRLKSLRDSVSDDSYGAALTDRLTGYVYVNEEKYKQAVRYFRKAVDANQFPKEIQQGTILTLAQLYGLVGQYRQTVDLLEEWFKTAKNPPTRAYVSAAKAYYELKELEPARKYIKLAIKQSDKPHEDWYNLLVGVDYDLKKTGEAIDTLKTMITIWPENGKYWRNLYGLYLQEDKRDKALEIGRIAYDKGLLHEGDQLLNLARLEIIHAMPYYAGEVISKGIDSGAIDSTIENLRLLIRAWSQARETDKALATLDKAAAKSDDGQLYLKKAQLCYQGANWQCAVKAARQAASKGGLDQPGRAWLFKGMALAQLKRYGDAKKAFQQATNYKDAKKQAKGWIQYVDNTLAATKG